MNSNHYKTLGLNPGAKEDEIKKAYKKLALKWHPDRNADNKKVAEEQFKKISQAYQCLINPNQNYDSINPNDIFNQFFNMNLNNEQTSNFGINIADIFNNIQSSNNRPGFSNFSTFSTLGNFGNVNGGFVSKQTQIYFENGKRIEKIIETINGIQTEKTIITDINTRIN